MTASDDEAAAAMQALIEMVDADDALDAVPLMASNLQEHGRLAAAWDRARALIEAQKQPFHLAAGASSETVHGDRELLERSFTACLCDECQPQTRLEYLGDHIFDFTTYDSGMSELFARKAVEVCKAISQGSTYDYIADDENHKWYLLMVNMPFFAGRLNWGTSIRGAWWDYDQPEFQSCGLYDGDGQQLAEPMRFNRDRWERFVAAIIDFARLDADNASPRSNEMNSKDAHQ